MAKFNSLKPIAAGLGLAVAASAVTLSGSANAAQNPFATQELPAGYQLASADDKSAEGKCGGEKKSESEGKCGDRKADKETKAEKEGTCGEGKDKSKTEGKCGEGKCGNMN